jgi:hypothetical protein
MQTSQLSRLLVPAALAALAVATTVPAQADEPGAKPAPRCGTSFTDPANDNNPAQVSTSADRDDGDVNLDILKGWFDHDASKGDKALTANLHVRELSKRIPTASNAVVWSFTYDVGDKTRFVRALIDFSGGPYYEYGSYQLALTTENPLPLNRYAYEGTTEGKFIEGKDGIIQIVVPKAAGADAGKLEAPWATGAAARQPVPGPVTQAPTRGVSSPVDTAPDGATNGSGGTAFRVSDCGPVESIAQGLKDDVTATAPAPPAAASSEPAATAAAPAVMTAPPALQVGLVNAKAKRLAKGKRLTLRLRSAEALTGVAVQVRRGTAVVAKGRLAKLAGTGALKLKLSRALGKGTYTVDIAGNDATGRHRLTTARLVVR